MEDEGARTSDENHSTEALRLLPPISQPWDAASGIQSSLVDADLSIRFAFGWTRRYQCSASSLEFRQAKSSRVPGQKHLDDWYGHHTRRGAALQKPAWMPSASLPASKPAGIAVRSCEAQRITHWHGVARFRRLRQGQSARNRCSGIADARGVIAALALVQRGANGNGIPGVRGVGASFLHRQLTRKKAGTRL